MNKRWFSFTASLLTLALLTYALGTRHGNLPAPGPFLNPFEGFWQLAGEEEGVRLVLLEHENLSQPVKVLFDDRNVPHIFAENMGDLFFAQGYVMAGLRLWQMDFLVRATSGRLAEVVGPVALPSDRMHRRKGFPRGAERNLAMVLSHPETHLMLEQYTAGVNAHIAGLSARKLPLEFKLMGYEPEEWTPLHTQYILMAMTDDLAGGTPQAGLTRTLALMGQDFLDTFYPDVPAYLDPVIPLETRFDFLPVVPEPPAEPFVPTILRRHPGPANDFISVNFSATSASGKYAAPDASVGSNSWAVSGQLTNSGRALLANDPHLSMTLPAIWTEMQLHIPDFNLYGVALPGIPGIVIGYNEHMAWGKTNSGADLLDIYEMTFKDESRSHYLFDGEWHAVTHRIETYKIRGESDITDTIRYTRHGPIAETGHALRWIAHYPSNPFRAYQGIYRSRNLEEFLQAIRYYDYPPQNFTYADTDGNIALIHNGSFPLRWHGQGRLISDGSDPAYEWHGWVPRDHLPASINPERGFVSSANQIPAGPDYPYYLGWRFATFERGSRINDLLSGSEGLSLDDMKAFQLDTYHYRAAVMVPFLIGMIDATAFGSPEQALLERMAGWDFHYDADRTEPVIFQAWWRNLYRMIFDDLYDKGRVTFPQSDQVVHLMITRPELHWFHRPVNGVPMSLEEKVRRSFAEAFRESRDENGELLTWSQQNSAIINHLARIPGLGRTHPSDGSALSLKVVSGQHGASWRMVVSMDERPKGFGVYPGGQSGNPGTKSYDAFVPTWLEGGYFEHRFFRDQDEAEKWMLNRKESRK